MLATSLYASFLTTLFFTSAAVAEVQQCSQSHLKIANSLKDNYIITLNSNTPEEKFKSHLTWLQGFYKKSPKSSNGFPPEVLSTYHIGSFRAYGARCDEATAKTVEGRPEVLAVEPARARSVMTVSKQKDAPWGLAALSSRKPGGETYTFDSSAGEGVFAYVVDTGITAEHEEFEGRATEFSCVSMITGQKECVMGTQFGDSDKENGHGTHVAGTIAGKTFGVAKKTKVIAVQAINGVSGSDMDLLKALELAGADVESKGRRNKAVLNYSIGGTCCRKPDGTLTIPECTTKPDWDLGTQFRASFTGLVQMGVFPVIAAGNDFVAASTTIPEAMNVGAIDKSWKEANFSNFGQAVDILAPGVEIMSAKSDTVSGSRTLSGTSQAAPHVAGLAAYLLAKEGPQDPVALKKRILDLATRNEAGIKNEARGLRRRAGLNAVQLTAQSSPNLVANNGFPMEEENPAPGQDGYTE